MKTTTALKSIALIAAIGAALAVSAMAQPGPGPGYGMGGGMGPGMGRGMRYNQNNTQGWTLMTAEERTAHQTAMRAVRTYDECKTLQATHRTAMEARAKEKGVTLPTPRQNACDNMKARGLIK